MPNPNLGTIGKTMGTAIQQMGDHSAKVAATANNVSFASQAAQGAFNQASANMANSLGTNRLAEQYAFNAAGANNANSFSEYMWDKSAAFNREMLEKQMQFNAEQAEINRKWQETMRATAYQTAIKDMETAGLNPILAVTGGGIQTGAGSGGAASASLPQMSGAQGAMASGGLLNGIAASEGNFTGQMEYMGGMLGIISMVLDGFSSAVKGIGSLGDFGESLGNALADILSNKHIDAYETFDSIMKPSDQNEFGRQYIVGRANQKDPNYKPYWRNGIDWNLKNYVNKRQ